MGRKRYFRNVRAIFKFDVFRTVNGRALIGYVFLWCVCVVSAVLRHGRVHRVHLLRLSFGYYVVSINVNS
ncbi:hypothetical protein M569_13430 [Genlisea aurea]|uniref:Uncharacterized protein n=1 Tax=Genlisea aurea TaxID=192259 RepID=S8DF47_9LAMI|nr:hypothetical protein M569_13430 [Genlisea aurea]